MPCFSNRIPSSTLPELHEPQSPTPAMTTSQLAVYSSMISLCAGTPELCLLRMIWLWAPYSCSRIAAIRSNSLSELYFVYSTDQYARCAAILAWARRQWAVPWPPWSDRTPVEPLYSPPLHHHRPLWPADFFRDALRAALATPAGNIGR